MYGQPMQLEAGSGTIRVIAIDLRLNGARIEIDLNDF